MEGNNLPNLPPGWKCTDQLPFPTPTAGHEKKPYFLSYRQYASIQIYLFVDIFLRRQELGLSNDRSFHEEIWKEMERRARYFLDYLELVESDRIWEMERDLQQFGVVRKESCLRAINSCLAPDLRNPPHVLYQARLLPRALRLARTWESSDRRSVEFEYGEFHEEKGDFYEDHRYWRPPPEGDRKRDPDEPLPKPHKRFRVEPGVRIKQEPE